MVQVVPWSPPGMRKGSCYTEPKTSWCYALDMPSLMLQDQWDLEHYIYQRLPIYAKSVSPQWHWLQNQLTILIPSLMERFSSFTDILAIRLVRCPDIYKVIRTAHGERWNTRSLLRAVWLHCGIGHDWPRYPLDLYCRLDCNPKKTRLCL